MIRYISICSFDKRAELNYIKEMDGAYVFRKDIPGIPHCVVNVRLVEYNPTYIDDRPRSSFAKRLWKALKEAWKTFKGEING